MFSSPARQTRSWQCRGAPQQSRVRVGQIWVPPPKKTCSEGALASMGGPHMVLCINIRSAPTRMLPSLLCVTHHVTTQPAAHCPET